MDEKQKEYLKNVLQSLCAHYEEGVGLKSEDMMQLLENTIEAAKIVAKNNKVALDKATDTALKRYFILRGFAKLPTEQLQRLMQHIEDDGSLVKGLL